MSDGIELRLAGVIRESIVDGPGIRLTVFLQGCPHDCPGCHNPETHNINGGYVGNIEKILEAVDADPLLRGITLSGGEPFLQSEAVLPLVKAIISRNKDIVVFSGYTFEELIELSEVRPSIIELLKRTFMLIDGRFIIERKNISLLFRGSENQRIIDVQKSLETRSAVLFKEYN
ncbi:MAG: anaerobic ribonucleoside-triphosphate reductase activating protein [Clostridia bacterium]